MGLRAIAVLGLATIPLNYAVLRRLLAIVETVRKGDPFVPTNASRLQAIAWALLGAALSAYEQWLRHEDADLARLLEAGLDMLQSGFALG